MSTDQLTIEELQFQCNPWNRKHPTIRLSWQTPVCHVSPRDIEYVIYVNDEELQVVSGPARGVTLRTLTPLKNYTFRVVTRHKRTKEEGLYYHSFETFLGESQQTHSYLATWILVSRCVNSIHVKPCTCMCESCTDVHAHKQHTTCISINFYGSMHYT